MIIPIDLSYYRNRRDARLDLRIGTNTSPANRARVTHFRLRPPLHRPKRSSAEPEFTSAEPGFLVGKGTKEQPFVLRPTDVLVGGSARSQEVVLISNQGPSCRSGVECGVAT